MMAWGLPSVLPATSRTPPASAGGLFFALDGRHPLAFELACPLQDRVFELGLDLSGDGGLEPVSVSEARLARYGHRQRVRTQCSSQDENVNLVALVWLATRRIPIGNQRSGERVLGGERDEIQRVDRGLPQDRAYGAPGLWARAPLRFFLGQTQHRPDRRLGIDFCGFARRSLLGIPGVRLTARRGFGARREGQRKTCGNGDRQAVMDNGHPAILGETVSSRPGARSESCARNGVPMEGFVAASKTHPVERVREALVAGHRVFGENRVQEAQAKYPELREAFPDLALHLIGSLQTNKVRDAVALCDMIETVDRPRLAQALAREMERSGRRPPCLIEVNTGEEPQKSGILPTVADDFIVECRDRLGLPIEGLMCVPPLDEEPALHFALLREIARRTGLGLLSMGMSADFEKAIRFGATHVRIGTAIFGARGEAG